MALAVQLFAHALGCSKATRSCASRSARCCGACL